MNQVNFYFDSRRPLADGTFPVRLKISNGWYARTFITTGVKLTPGEWETISTRQRIADPRLSKIKRSLDRMKLDCEDVIYDLETHTDNPTPVDIRREYDERLNPDKRDERIARENEARKLSYWFRKRMELKSGKTRDSISQTLSRITAFDEKALIADVTPSWLQKFDLFMARTSPSANARAVHMRNLRAVINFAIDEGVQLAYPFRRFKIKTVKTAKRSLSADELRAFLNIKCFDASEQKYLDMFKLIFLLIGINTIDLLHLRHTDMQGGRIVYNRSKTKKLYSIKVEPEAAELLEKYRGERWLIDPLDRVGNWEQYRKRLNKTLRVLGNTTLGKKGKKLRDAMFPNITTYWARHSWATIAASLDIPKETIAAALGHGGNTVTDIYINFDTAKVDAANRKVIDWVLYGKKNP